MKVEIYPPNFEINVQDDETLLEAFIKNGVKIQNLCGGKGICGKCKIKFDSGAPQPGRADTRLINKEELERGYRLACSVQGRDLNHGNTVKIHLDTEGGSDRKELAVLNIDEITSDICLKKINLKVEEPSLYDERGDWDRLKDHIKEYAGGNPVIGRHLLQSLTGILRESKYNITTVLWNNEFIAVEKGDTEILQYGVALDIGTTSVSAALVDLKRKEILDIYSAENGQSVYGADVISRIAYAKESVENARKLTEAILETINGLLYKFVNDTGVDSRNIYIMTVVANTCMHHLVLGLSIENLAESPYVSACNSSLIFNAQDVGIGIHPLAKVLFFPNISGFIGGDMTGAVLGCYKIFDNNKIHLLVDLGTNCELFLKKGDRMLACSTAAGPAFEGAGIKYGMRARPGAIEGVKVTESGISVSVIGNEEPEGICGSGLIQAVSEFRRAGVVNKQGNIEKSFTGELSSIDIREAGGNEKEIILARNNEGNYAIVLTQKDIRQLQLAKAAISAGIQTLLDYTGITITDLDSIILSGTFSSYLNIQSVLRIGLIPEVPVSKFIIMDNAAMSGALQGLINYSEFEKAGELAGKVEHMELANSPEFSEYFMQSMYFDYI